MVQTIPKFATKHDRVMYLHRRKEDATEYRPIDVYRRLRISPATLRRWSADFAPYLSKQAGGCDAAQLHRRYTAGDIRVLSTIRNLRHAGITTSGIETQLAQAMRQL